MQLRLKWSIKERREETEQGKREIEKRIRCWPVHKLKYQKAQRQRECVSTQTQILQATQSTVSFIVVVGKKVTTKFIMHSRSLAVLLRLQYINVHMIRHQLCTPIKKQSKSPGKKSCVLLIESGNSFWDRFVGSKKK